MPARRSNDRTHTSRMPARCPPDQGDQPMAKPELWPTIRAERNALAADLEPLTGAQWATSSLCGEWSVREVLGHMTATAAMTPPRFFSNLIGSGFRFSAMQGKDVAKQNEGTPDD